MYLLNWNPNESKIEASFGGHVSVGEANVFAEELRELVVAATDTSFVIVVDWSTASRMDQAVLDVLETARETCLFAGSQKVTFVTRDETEAANLTNRRLQQVLEGREEYVAYGIAA